MSARRSRGEGGLFWNESKQRWVVDVTVGYDGRGKRVKRRQYFRTKTAAKNALRKVLADLAEGQVDDHRLTVADAVNEWLEFGLSHRSEQTRVKARSLCERHIIPKLGKRRLRELTALEVEDWLAGLAKELSTQTIRQARSCLSRSIRRAMLHGRVKRNVVEVTEVPAGQMGRPSKALTPEQVDQVLEHTKPDRMHGYIVLSVLTGARTEELRALQWDHVFLEPELIKGRPAVPPHIAVWRSVRARNETKTPKSRRTLALPAMCIAALRKQKTLQATERLAAGHHWQETGLVFTTSLGTAMDAANVRRDFRRALALVPDLDPKQWTPRELRHSFVSLLADAQVPVETISQLVGHRGTTVTELVYRHQVRPVIQTGALIIDGRFERDDA